MTGAVIFISIVLYNIFTVDFEKNVVENRLVFLIVKTLFALFDMGVAVALLR